MPTFVAFLRAVNVAPRWMPMVELRAALETAGFTEVVTHIQTGNARLVSESGTAEEVEARVEAAVGQRFGFHSDVMVRTPAALRSALDIAEAAPRADGETRRYISFVKREIVQGRETIQAWSVPGERAMVTEREVHWGLEGTIHTSSLSNARLERLLGQPATARDLKVVRAVVAKWCAA